MPDYVPGSTASLPSGAAERLRSMRGLFVAAGGALAVALWRAGRPGAPAASPEPPAPRRPEPAA